MRGLIVRSPWIDLIFDGRKPWEIRGTNTHKRETIALIQSGTGLIMGTVDLIDCIKLTKHEFTENRDKHCIENNLFPITYKQIFAWVLERPIRFTVPKPYKHPGGAVIWVKLIDEEEWAI